MAKSPRVSFKTERIAEGDWHIIAEFPGEEDRIIRGLVSKDDVNDWLSGSRKVQWLRAQGYAK